MKSFTLIELIIYIAIVSAVLVLASGFAWNIIQGSTRVTSYREVQQNARFAMEKITRALRAGSDPGIFTILDGVLYQEGYPLTTDQVKVTNFEITSIADTYRVNLRVEYNNPGGMSEYEAEVDLKSTACVLPGEPPPEGCWGTGGFCDPLCQYSDYGSLVDYYTDPGCSDSCPSAGSFYLNPSEICSSDGTGSCYQMEASSSQYTSCSQGADCESGCAGTCTPCDQFNDSTQCEFQLGCRWLGKKCRGTCTTCDTFIDQTSCENQLGCSWQTTKWYWNLVDPQDGYSLTDICEWYVQ